YRAERSGRGWRVHPCPRRSSRGSMSSPPPRPPDAVSRSCHAMHAAAPGRAVNVLLLVVFGVVFSPFELGHANNVRNPGSPFALGDEVVFHDQLFANGRHVGDAVGSCVIVDLTPDLPNNCSAVFRVPGGDITSQFSTSPGPAPRPLAVTGGTGIYRNIG